MEEPSGMSSLSATMTISLIGIAVLHLWMVMKADAIVAFNTLLDRHVERLRSMQVEINLDIMGQKACSCSVLYRYIIKALDISTMARRLTSLEG